MCFPLQTAPLLDESAAEETSLPRKVILNEGNHPDNTLLRI